MQSELLKSFYLVESSYSKGKKTVKWRAFDNRRQKLQPSNQHDSQKLVP